ncbi:hypothetical protein HKD42_06625 [Altererythrobacter sp. RZ02]|uniref:Uncharacterized protein n=1 Tax=Pontixanthobacter rizhaonensis TaxID=2730337 RepID=A0A848QLW6_9SPHN|nr:hypothetical protein [Pontixanthobacter rizhaonensis]NMW31730.1 hypothetical protein [Pontixanthobacter rizhaonensis]
MRFFDIKCFTDEATAKAYYRNVIREDDEAAAIFVRDAGLLSHSHNNSPPQDIGPNENVYTVIRVPVGTKVAADQITLENTEI